MSQRKFRVPFAESLELKNREDADLLLLGNAPAAGFDFDVSVIRFASRAALEAFNQKAGLRPVIKTQVALNCAVHKHETDEEARKLL